MNFKEGLMNKKHLAMSTLLAALLSAAGILLLAFLSCLLLPAPALTVTVAQELVKTLHLLDMNQLYILIFCVWFLALGTIEYFVIRFIWRRWFSIQRM